MPNIAFEWQHFRQFSTAGLYELLRFRQAIFVVEQRSPFPDLDGLDQEALHLLLRVDDALAGCLRLVPPPRLRIGRVAVATKLRRQRLGRRLIETALALCALHYPGQPIRLTAQLPLTGFYASLGFIAASPPFDDCGVPHLHMRRRPD